MKYAVMVPFDDTFIYVSDINKDTYEATPTLHDTREAAQEAASISGAHARVVEYIYLEKLDPADRDWEYDGNGEKIYKIEKGFPFKTKEQAARSKKK